MTDETELTALGEAPGRRGRASAAELAAARLMLSRMGISPGELLDPTKEDVPVGVTAASAVPTFAEYIPIVAAAVSPGTRRVYGTYWDRVLAQWAARRLNEPTPSQIMSLVDHVKTHTVTRRNARGGRSAAEHLIGALRCLYRHAERDGLITETDNPARKVAKPRRLPSNRRAVPDTRLAELNQVAARTGNDPSLDTLLLRLHVETACRRGGALALRPRDLDPAQCLILLREKGETVRWQPVSPTLMTALLSHAQHRHAPHDGQLLRSIRHQPITSRRYDYLWTRLGTHLPWVATQQISTHWLRHTTLTWVERTFGHAVASAYAGHTGTGQHEATISIYTRAGLDEVATALSALTGEPHPLAHAGPSPTHS
jgi:integrase